ncbi:hypothetical protein IFM89_013378 [Coptis chinensis]|uniref:Probable purine permease n=1 Tax=Coptis chinensis TaxID=261450 RepID=A0A835I227_9MAGN|nr:hypothetical protein IFM89_013378 [Coptis chinensis]
MERQGDYLDYGRCEGRQLVPPNPVVLLLTAPSVSSVTSSAFSLLNEHMIGSFCIYCTGSVVSLNAALTENFFLCFLSIEDSQQPNSSTTTEFSPKDATVINQPPIPRHRHFKWWILVSIYTILVLTSQSGATLLGRFYFDSGGNSKWLATLVYSGGFPIFIPYLLFSTSTSSIRNPSNITKRISPMFIKVALVYIFFGVVSCVNNLLYSYGLLYLPVSTYSLICATQLAFNALFSYFLNSLKFTHFILNSLVLLTISAAVLGIQGESPGPSNIPKGKFVVGFLCTLGASALYSLLLSLIQVFFEKFKKNKTFSVAVEMIFFTALVTTSACVVGLFVSGEWRGLKGEMEGFETGRVSYVMTLVWTALLWQVYSISSVGLIYEASSLFSNIISTVCLPVVPLCAVILFHDKMEPMKVVAMLLAIWGFVSYVYEHYLDYLKSKTTRTSATGILAS